MLRYISNKVNILVKTKHRKPGKAVIEGKERTWGEAYQIVCVQVEDEKFETHKYTILPEKVPEIWKKLEKVSWGCLIQLDFEGYLIADVEILSDWFGDFMNAMN